MGGSPIVVPHLLRVLAHQSKNIIDDCVLVPTPGFIDFLLRPQDQDTCVVHNIPAEMYDYAWWDNEPEDTEPAVISLDSTALAIAMRNHEGRVWEQYLDGLHRLHRAGATYVDIQPQLPIVEHEAVEGCLGCLWWSSHAATMEEIIRNSSIYLEAMRLPLTLDLGVSRERAGAFKLLSLLPGMTTPESSPSAHQLRELSVMGPLGRTPRYEARRAYKEPAYNEHRGEARDPQCPPDRNDEHGSPLKLPASLHDAVEDDGVFPYESDDEVLEEPDGEDDDGLDERTTVSGDFSE